MLIGFEIVAHLTPLNTTAQIHLWTIDVDHGYSLTDWKFNAILSELSELSAVLKST